MKYLTELKHNLVKAYREWGWITPDGKWINGLMHSKYQNHGDVINNDYNKAYKLGAFRYFTLQNTSEEITFSLEFAPKYVTEKGIHGCIKIIKQLNKIEKIDRFFLDPIKMKVERGINTYENMGGKEFMNIGQVEKYFNDLKETKNYENNSNSKKYYATLKKKNVTV